MITKKLFTNALQNIYLFSVVFSRNAPGAKYSKLWVDHLAKFELNLELITLI